jgi:excisionase family DNA binding protein
VSLSASRLVPRVTLTRAEAAQALGMSVDHFERHVQPDLRVVRSGRLVLVPLRELERWVDEAAHRVLGEAA